MESPQPSTGGGSGAGDANVMKRCPSCGAKNKGSFEYCVRCAEPLDEWAPEGVVAQGRALQAKLAIGAVVAIGVLLAFGALRAMVAPAPEPGSGTDAVATTAVGPADMRVEEPILPNTTPKEAFETFKEGVRAFNAGDYGLAVDVFRGVVSDLPDNPAAFQYLGLAFYHLGNYEDALGALEDARDLRPDSFELIDHYVTAAKKGENIDAALVALKDFVERHPESVKARLELSRLARESGDSELALQQAEYLSTSGDADPVFVYEYGVSLKEAGKLDEAKVALKSSIELDPSSAAAHHALGVTELLSGNARDAVGALEAAVTRAPTNGDFRFSLAQAYEKSDRVRESLEAYEAYLEHAKPGDARAQVVRARLEVAKKALAERNQRSGGTM